MASRLLKPPLVAALLLVVWCGAPTAAPTVAQEGAPETVPVQPPVDVAPESGLGSEPDPVPDLEPDPVSEPVLLETLPDELSDDPATGVMSGEAIGWEDADHSPLDQEVEEGYEEEYEEDGGVQSDPLSYRSPLIWLPLLALSWIVLMRLARRKRVDLGGDGYSHYLSYKGRKEADRQRSAARCDKRPSAF